MSSAVRSGGRSVAPGMAASDHRWKRGQSSTGTPSRSAMMRSGKGTARLGHHVDRLAGGQRRNRGPGPLGHRRLQAAHHRGGERRLHQPAVAGVGRRVGVHHGRRGVVADADLVEQDAPPRAEGRRGRRGGDLGVAGQHPGAGGGVPGHGAPARTRARSGKGSPARNPASSTRRTSASMPSSLPVTRPRRSPRPVPPWHHI